MDRRSSAGEFPVSQGRDSCVPDDDDRRGRHSTARDGLDRIRTSWSTAIQHASCQHDADKLFPNLSETDWSGECGHL